MLFYDFKVECKYGGKQSLARAFAKSPREGRDAVCAVNEALSEEIRDGRGTCAFIYHGKPAAWRMAAAFGAKEKVSEPSLHEYLEEALREYGGAASFTMSDLREITAEAFLKIRRDAEDCDFIENRRRPPLNIELDFFDNSDFKLCEELREEPAPTKEEALARAREILADQSLLDELSRIYSEENIRGFYGHPVHYKVVAGTQETALSIVRLLTDALHANGRLSGRRITVVHEIKENCYDEYDMRAAFTRAAGTTLVIDLRGSNEEHSNYASAYERVAEFFAELVREHHKNVLCVFIERTDNPGFTPSLMAKVEEFIDIIGLSEGVGNRAESTAYLRHLVREAEFEVMNEAEIVDSLAEKTSFTASDLYNIYNRFYKDGLKNKLYRSYRTAKYVAVDTKKPEGDAYDRLQIMVGLAEVKKLVDQIIAAHKVQKMRMEVGLPKESTALHMIFTGNPGSAKTTVARLLAEILKKEGVLESGTFVECGRSDLVGRYVGWTAPTVKEKFRRARGGVLFIDEAYSLVDDRDGLYGDEAINTIVQEMENQRDSVIVIFAGYREKMEGFLEKNEGLRSRIAFHVDFPDYDADELTEIIALMAKDKGYEMDGPVLARCREIFRTACEAEEFGNGRFARNLLEQALLKQSRRIIAESGGRPLARETLLALVPSDFDVNLSARYAKKRGGIGFV